MTKESKKLEVFDRPRTECPKCAGQDFMVYGEGRLCTVECEKCGHRWREPDPDEVETVECKFCYEQVMVDTAHLHNGNWVGDECCWDERLRSTE